MLGLRRRLLQVHGKPQVNIISYYGLTSYLTYQLLTNIINVSNIHNWIQVSLTWCFYL